MIIVKKSKNDVWRACNNCGNKENYDIEIKSLGLCLCKKCLAELNKKVSELENEDKSFRR